MFIIINDAFVTADENPEQAQKNKLTFFLKLSTNMTYILEIPVFGYEP